MGSRTPHSTALGRRLLQPPGLPAGPRSPAAAHGQGRLENVNSFLRNNHGWFRCRRRVSRGEESFYLNQYRGVISEDGSLVAGRGPDPNTPIPVQFQAASHFFVPLFAAVSAHRRVHLHTGPRGTREDAASRRRGDCPQNCPPPGATAALALTGHR